MSVAIDITTNKTAKLLHLVPFLLFGGLQNKKAYTLPWVAPTTHSTLYIYQLN